MPRWTPTRRLLAALLAALATGVLTMAEPTTLSEDPEFARVVAPAATLETVASGLRFTEGPVWSDEEGGFLLFSDIPGDRIYRWSAAGGLSVFREPSHNANGNTRDAAGRLLTCEHGSRRVTRTERDGTATTLAERFQGKRLNSPNDIVVDRRGRLWFTDPPYGLQRQEVGKELDKQHVFRLDASDGSLVSVAEDFDRPNGLCFSPDESLLYIADSSSRRHVRVFSATPDGALVDGRVFCEIDKGVPDGMRVDREGRLYSSAGDGVHVFAPDGRRLGKILTPQGVANLCFGGADRRTLYMTAHSAVYAIRVETPGI